MDISLKFIALGILLGLSLRIYRFLKKRDVSKKEFTISPLDEIKNSPRNINMKNNHNNIPLILVASKQPTVVAPQPISVKEGESLSKYENCYFNVLTWIDELKITADGRYLLSRDEQINGNKQIIKIWDIEQNRVVKIYENMNSFPLKEQKFLESFSGSSYSDILTETNYYYDDILTVEMIDKEEDRWKHLCFYPYKYILNDIYLSEKREGVRPYMLFSDDERGEILIKSLVYSFAPLPFDESHSSEYIFSKSKEESLEIWKREREKLFDVDIAHEVKICCIDISQDEKYMVSGARSCYSDGYNCLNLWDLEKGVILKSFEEAHDIHSVCFSPDGAYILSGSGRNCNQDYAYLQIWDVKKEKLIYSIVEEKNDNKIELVGVHIDGKKIVSQNDEFGTKGEMHVWNIGKIEDFKVLSGTIKGLKAVTVSEDKRYIVSASQGNIVSVWDRENYQLLESFILNYESFSGVESLSISSDNRYIGLKVEEKVKLWDREEKILYAEHELTKEMKMDNSYEDSQEHILVSKDGSTVQVRSIESSKLLQEYIAGKEGNWMIRDFEAQKVYKGDNGNFLFEKKEVWREGESVVFEVKELIE